MTDTLKLLFIAGSIITFIFVIRKIRKSQLQIVDSIAWIIGALFMIFISVFSDFVIRIAGYFGFYSASNFILVVIVFLLLMLVFNQNIKLSILNEKLKDLNHHIALHEKDEKDTK